MSVKFLPFITEKSSEPAIFKAIVQRTKGYSSGTVADLYAIVLNLGIKEARKKVESFPEELTTTEKIKELISQHPQHHVKKSEQLFWSCVMHHEDSNKDSDYDNYSLEEKELMFSTIAICKPENLAGAGFKLGNDLYKVYANTEFDINTRNIKGIKIAEDKSERIGFTSWEELKAYVAFNANRETKLTVLPVFMQESRKAITESDYEKNHCTSPYKRN